MPSPEGSHDPSPEHEHGFYCRAARFPDEPASGKAYFQAQEAIRETSCDLSTYRFQLHQLWHVAVLGSPPPHDLAQRIEAILATGNAATLPTDIMDYLKARRAEVTQQGTWVERHYRKRRRFR
jgi:hypothetical protein